MLLQPAGAPFSAWQRGLAPHAHSHTPRPPFSSLCSPHPLALRPAHPSLCLSTRDPLLSSLPCLALPAALSVVAACFFSFSSLRSPAPPHFSLSPSVFFLPCVLLVLSLLSSPHTQCPTSLDYTDPLSTRPSPPSLSSQPLLSPSSQCTRASPCIPCFFTSFHPLCLSPVHWVEPFLRCAPLPLR